MRSIYIWKKRVLQIKDTQSLITTNMAIYDRQIISTITRKSSTIEDRLRTQNKCKIFFLWQHITLYWVTGKLGMTSKCYNNALVMLLKTYLTEEVLVWREAPCIHVCILFEACHTVSTTSVFLLAMMCQSIHWSNNENLLTSLLVLHTELSPIL